MILRAPRRFGSWRGAQARRFTELCLGVREVHEVEIDATAGTAMLRFAPGVSAAVVLRRLARVLRGEQPPDFCPTLLPPVLRLLPKTQARLRVFRFGKDVATVWEPRVQAPGVLRLRQAAVLRKAHLVGFLERELAGLMGIQSLKAHPRAGSLTIHFDAQIISPAAIVRQLDLALAKAPARLPRGHRREDCNLVTATASLALAAGASVLAPALLPVAGGMLLFTALPSFRRAVRALWRERRLSVDALDAILFTICIATGEIFPGALAVFLLSLGRRLVDRTQANSARVLLHAFGKQPASVWLLPDGNEDAQEVEIPLEKLRAGDRIVVHPGEAVPVDGIIVRGEGLLDQHTLTGEAAPAEKAAGEIVFASTLLLAGRIVVEVQKAGKATAAGRIQSILERTVAYRPHAQGRGEHLADQAVVPELGLAALAAGTVGPSAGLAVINSEIGTAIRMAAPLGLLSMLTLCIRHGILIKDGRALERMREVDTILFDKTGTLTREVPEVGRILCSDPNRHDEGAVLALAAAAEQWFKHPIARAILERFRVGRRPLPKVDESQVKVGYGITAVVRGETVRVGSLRFMEMERLTLPPDLRTEAERMLAEGHGCVFVAVGDRVAGALELRASQRPEARDLVKELRRRGIRHLGIVSGDHERPTRALAERLGVDRHFAEVLPQDKARCIAQLQREGRTVCFVGDGINDAPALRRADVSVSLRGASGVATDAAQVVFMEESLAKLGDLLEYSRGLDRNVRRSWHLLLAPNLLCVAGVFLAGFNLWHSVVLNNAATLLALGNGLLPLAGNGKHHPQIPKPA